MWIQIRQDKQINSTDEVASVVNKIVSIILIIYLLTFMNEILY